MGKLRTFFSSFCIRFFCRGSQSNWSEFSVLILFISFLQYIHIEWRKMFCLISKCEVGKKKMFSNVNRKRCSSGRHCMRWYAWVLIYEPETREASQSERVRKGKGASTKCAFVSSIRTRSRNRWSAVEHTQIRMHRSQMAVIITTQRSYNNNSENSTLAIWITWTVESL